MKVTRGVLFFRGVLAFIGPGLAVFITAASAYDSKPSEWLLWILILGGVSGGAGALSAWFDNSYGRATNQGAPPNGQKDELNFAEPVKATPEEQVVQALIARGLSEATARNFVANSLQEAALLAGVELSEL